MSISQNFPTIPPSLNLNFARSKKLDPRITFTRTSSATRTNGQGLIEVISTNTPRFEHSVVGVGSTVTSVQSLGLLIEESRTNSLKYSNSFSTGGAGNWTTVGATCVFTQNITGPDGVSNSAWTIDDQSTANDAAGFEQAVSITPSASTNYCLSIFTKKGTSASFDFYAFFTGTSTKGSVIKYNFNTDAITVSSADGGGITPTIYGKIQYPNGWYRLYFVVNDANSGLNNNLQFRIYPGTREAGFTGTTLFYGAQFETGAFPTSYIPTVASTVTRSGDLAYIDLPSTGWYNNSQGSLVFQHSTVPYGTGTSPGYPAIGFAQTNGGSTNSIQYFFVKDTGATQYLIRDVNVDQATISPTTPTGASAGKVGFAYTTNSFVLARNGSQVGTDTSGTVPQSIGTLLLGTNSKTVANNLNACISNVIYYPRALSSSQLQNLTK